jgi:hypothetical protein
MAMAKKIYDWPLEVANRAKRGPKRKDNALRIEQFAVEFVLGVLAGESSGNARRKAAEKTKMGMDDDELATHLRKFFDLKELPYANEEWMWKGIAANWVLRHPDYRERYPKLPSALDFVPPHLR